MSQANKAMKVTDWRIYTPDKRFHVFVNVETDAGVSGWGSAYSEKGQVLGALAWLKRFVIGENPLEIERVTERLHQITFWLGRGGAMTHAISAINLALWDVTGKILRQPVHVLLGGRQRTTVAAYGSILFRPLETLSERVQAMRKRGFRAMKLGWDPFAHGSIPDDERMVAAARKYAGDDVTLMIDDGGSSPNWHLRWKDALERARMLRNYGIYWFEEPLAPDDIEGYARLTERSEVRIAHGEVLTRRQSFVPYFERRAMDVVQPDATKVGGLSEMRRIAWMAEERGIELVPHGWNTAIGVAADIQLVSTLPSKSFVEFNVGNPLVEDVLIEPFQLDGAGNLSVSDAPGLGIDVCAEKLQRLETDGFASETWTWDM
jgi:L-alanine-DL-glutamate epimerase-like enolase superfamily enzyme